MKKAAMVAEGLRLYYTWRSMINRCCNPLVKGYPYYGGKGIQVCKRWLNFENFISDMGPRPRYTSLERINNSGDYKPKNCRWATRSEQARNKSNNRLITFNGKTKILADWASDLGITPGALINRITYKRWSIEKALTTPKPERPNAKLNMRQARAIRATYPNLSMDKIAAKYGVSKKTILNIVHHKIFLDHT